MGKERSGWGKADTTMHSTAYNKLGPFEFSVQAPLCSMLHRGGHHWGDDVTNGCYEVLFSKKGM